MTEGDRGAVLILRLWKGLLLLCNQGLEHMLQMHCSLEAYCACRILTIPTFAARCLHVLHDARDPSSKRWNFCGRRNWLVILPRMSTSTLHFRVLLHAVNLWHGTDGFTSPPKEGMLRIFSPLKIRRLWPSLNPRTWVLKANTLPQDHQSRSEKGYS